MSKHREEHLIDGGRFQHWINAADFNGLHSRRHDHEVEFYAFDILDGQDVRGLPLSMRKANLARLLARRVDGIFVSISSRARSVRTYSGTPA